jgi:hypothetical protein
VLVACVGNLLRRDDGFGVAVARTLADMRLPDGTVVIETGIGGLGIVHELMNGYDGLVIVDAVDVGASPGRGKPRSRIFTLPNPDACCCLPAGLASCRRASPWSAASLATRIRTARS